KAQLATLAALRPGITGGDVDAVARNIITDAGYGAFYEHGTGHGVGVEIHEAPWFRRENPQVLEAGMIGTVEPGIYLPGKGGVRIEDMVAITQDGYENFYTVSKDLIVL
ncbi:MAG: M24 family metallopeptidase, partial [Clostridiales bacterium]|nr:M24 family metallopeptidase [Clostridiales bacterium]